ncbi:MAG: FHA domain-containing protein [Chloroflexota bacterium]
MDTISKYQLVFGLEHESKAIQGLGFGENFIGRAPECSIRLSDPQVSRRHACLYILPEGCWIMDMGSANGTPLDGKPLSPHRRVPITIGQSFDIGPYQFSLQPLRQLVETVTDGTSGPPEAATMLNEQSGETIEEGKIREVKIIHLRIRDESGSEKSYFLGKGEWLLGRSDECQVQIQDQAMSRHHLLIKVSDDRLIVSDPGSRNGVLYNGNRLPAKQEQTIPSGSSLQIANYRLFFDSILQSEALNGQFIGIQPPVGKPKPSSQIPKAAAPQPSKPLGLMGLEKLTIGRAKDNHMVIDHPQVSRYHAIIERMGTRYRLVDLKSHNSTFLNGTRVEGTVWLKEGDRIKIGQEQFLFTGLELDRSTPEGYTIDVVNVNKWVTKSLNLLKNITFCVGQNEFVGLVGMSGAGKTTLQDTINGFRPATDGEVRVNGINLYENYDMFRNDIGYVPQRDIVHMELTPTMSLDYAAQLRMPPDTSLEEREAAVNQTLEELGLSFRKDILNARLSGGQLKRVSIGVELLTRPKLFFLDEPTSGLDPGTEYEMMKLLRRLADQGRTIMIITHATKNVMVCDKVIILATGGYMAYYGPPEDALTYFDKFRTPRERLEKDMEFDDIYRILNDATKGTPEEWGKRYNEESVRLTNAGRIKIPGTQPAQPAAHVQKSPARRISGFRQFFVLSSRGTKILLQDKVSLGLMLGLAPLLGFMNFIWGTNLFDPVLGDSPKTMAMWFMTTIIGVLVGALSSVREIVKEADIFKRERAVGLKIFPYTLSKLWVGVALAVYSGIVILFFVVILVRPSMPNLGTLISWIITTIIIIIVSYLLGLVISAGVPNQNASLIVLIAVLVPQLLFAGVLLPLEEIPFRLGTPISFFITSRWGFEGFVRASEVFDPLINDDCWVKKTKDERQAMTDDDKQICKCMGPQLFEDANCGKIPGIKSPDYYDQTAQDALAQPEPIKPIDPTRIPSPTPIFTPTPYATPTALSMEKYGRDQQSYKDDVDKQQTDYSDSRTDQFESFRQEMKDQGNNFADESRQQFEDYSDEMEIYGENKTDWKKERESAIASSESILAMIYDDYGRSFKGIVFSRWFVLFLQGALFFSAILFFQKRKDVV